MGRDNKPAAPGRTDGPALTTPYSRDREMAAVCAERDEALRAAARLRAVLDNAHDAFVSMSADGVILAWNPAAEQLFGWTAAEAVGRLATELMIPPSMREAHERGLERARRSRTSHFAGRRLEFTVVDRSGREFPVEMTLQTQYERGEPVHHAFLHDITVRTTARVELTRERAYLQALLNSLDTGVAACDSNGTLAQFNSAMCEIHGLGHQPIGPESWAGTYHLFRADGRTPMKPEEVPLARAFAGEFVRHEEMVVRASGRPPHWFLTNARPIDSADGHRLGAVVAMHDVTDAHRAEVLQRCRYAVARALAEATSARDAAIAAATAIAAELDWACAECWEVDEERRRIVRVSSWGRPGADLAEFSGDTPLAFGIGQGLPGVVWAAGTDVWSDDLDDLVDPGRLPPARRLGLRATIGMPVHSGARVAGVLAFFTDTGVTRDDDILAMLRDVAAQIGRFVERRRAEDLTLALAAARRDFNRVIEQINDCFWTVEMMPDGSVRSVYSSPGATGVFGGTLPTGADMADTLTERMHPDDREAFRAYHERIGTGEPAEFECRIIGYDGRTRWVWTRGVTRHEDGHLYVDGISTNVTERRELADQRELLLAKEQEQVRRLRELDRMKDELVAVVSHEMRNPIAIIAAHTDALLEQPEFAGRAELVSIERTSARLMSLVEDLLDLARFESGPTVLDPRPVRLDRLLRQAVEEHRLGAPVDLITEVGDLPMVSGDAARLRQVLDNLLSNAIKYTPPGGTVTVTARDDADTVTVTVTDTGIGIPPEQYPKLFTRFFRASTAIDHKIKGTGLGLAVTKAIVEAHGGTIAAEPGPAGGTRFTVTLPRSPGQDPAAWPCRR
ncbi:PAS domain-containing sensor histidine kinase [Actinoplanes flavus]|uniref:Sensor-like histidine kinase SenX3 n=1 Tax=Actinoplanes flavus TaxID=2820290 RepID=A0ABS3UDW3_9ACTN|nr:PAS domain S-box protein [Actinoplanes flavus]MBO3736977.1 PAS domain S-box protein [Actinoplanes flavus]